MENVLSERVDVFEGSFRALSGPVLVTTSTAADFVGLASAVASGEADEVSVLTDEQTARDVRDAFLLASRVADLLEAGTLEVRVATPASPFSTVLLGTGAVRSVASVGGGAVTELRGEADGAFVETAREAFRDRWADAEAFDAGAPPYSRMLSAMEDRLGESTRADLEAAIEAAPRGDVRPVRLSLLAGARNEVQFYELGRWGESEGVASRAKFSREKQALEDAGLLETEKVPTDVGRPRQRLVLPAGFAGTTMAELASAARDVRSR